MDDSLDVYMHEQSWDQPKMDMGEQIWWQCRMRWCRSQKLSWWFIHWLSGEEEASHECYYHTGVGFMSSSLSFFLTIHERVHFNLRPMRICMKGANIEQYEQRKILSWFGCANSLSQMRVSSGLYVGCKRWPAQGVYIANSIWMFWEKLIPHTPRYSSKCRFENSTFCLDLIDYGSNIILTLNWKVLPHSE